MEIATTSKWGLFKALLCQVIIAITFMAIIYQPQNACAGSGGGTSCRSPDKFPARSALPASVLMSSYWSLDASGAQLLKGKIVSSKLTKDGRPHSFQLLTTSDQQNGSCAATGQKINFAQAHAECAARSMRLCTVKERLQALDNTCAFWTGNLCNKGKSRVLFRANKKRLCVAPSTRAATTISCCMDTVNAPACDMCPAGTFAKPEWTRMPNERGEALCAAENKRPNIVFIISDDMRYFDFSQSNTSVPASFASPTVSSKQMFPNLSKYVQDGVFFKNAHVQIAMCSPSRDSFMTGLRPDSTKLYSINDIMRKVKVTTIAQALKADGYQTYAFGKIFDGRSTGGRDDQDYPQSWTVRPVAFVGLTWTSNVSESNCGYGDPPFNSRTNNKPFAQCVLESPLGAEASFATQKELVDEKIAKLAIDKIDTFANEQATSPNTALPFFLAVGFMRPHLPFVAEQRHFQRFQRSDFPFIKSIDANRNDIFTPPAYKNDEPMTYTGWTGTSTRLYPTPSVHSQFVHGYYAACSSVDEMVGRVVDRVQSHPSLVNDTFFVFFGDHGYHLGDHEFYGKKTVYESATHVPLLLFGPERFFPQRGRVITSPVELVDLVPTLYEMTGLVDRPSYQGTSLVPLFRAVDPVERVKSLALSQFYAFGPMKKSVRSYSMRGDRFRYVAHYDFVKKQIIYYELYDYSTDPLEASDVKATFPDIVAKFKDLFQTYLKNMSAYKAASIALPAGTL